jgi:hypothetical protein
MRITRETLIRIARETAQKRVFSDPELAAAYMTGSLRTDNPFLGGATDIDIIFVHPGTPKIRREIVAVTPEIHLDILHNPRADYEKPAELRLHPWLGPELYDPLPLHVTHHFFEFVQAGVRDKYNEPESILARARTSAARARQIWLGLGTSQETGPALLLTYLKGVSHAANAITLMSNSNPLAERRFLLQFPARAEAVEQPGLADQLSSLLGADRCDLATLSGFLPEWEKTFLEAAARPNVERRIAAPRLGYYKLACESMQASETPQTAVWPLILTWTLSAAVLPPMWKIHWREACETLGLGADSFSERLEGLDHFLDAIEEMLEKMSASQGL